MHRAKENMLCWCVENSLMLNQIWCYFHFAIAYFYLPLHLLRRNMWVIDCEQQDDPDLENYQEVHLSF